MFAHLLALFRAPVREITSAELAVVIASGAPPVLIDIRSAEQFAAGHLPGAIHIPLARLRQVSARLDPAVATVVY